jgi:hypothetical protein
MSRLNNYPRSLPVTNQVFFRKLFSRALIQSMFSIDRGLPFTAKPGRSMVLPMAGGANGKTNPANELN